MDHVPVLARETVHYLIHSESRLVLDGTVGCGGHARAVLEADPSVRVVGLDTDGQALAVAARALAPYGARVRLMQESYANLPAVSRAFGRFDGTLLDLGVSSLHLDEPSRGFSYLREGPLDMRMSGEGETAGQFIDRISEMELADVLKRYGELARARRIARTIKLAAARGELRSTLDLKRAVDTALGGRSSPALLSQVFQAIRIAVNREADSIRAFIASVLASVNPNARLVFISYHSLEDSLIKDFVRRESRDCVCPPQAPVCVCGHEATLEVLTPRVVRPAAAEVGGNPRARSARLRAVRVISRPSE